MLFLTLTLSALKLSIAASAASSGEPGLNPATAVSLQEAHALSCPELDSRLTALEPQTYTDTPGFYSDPLQGSAVWIGILWSPAWAYLGYASVMEQYRQGRMADTLTQMEQLRLLKAQQHCYER
jgi:hypothetical protein